MEKQGQHSLILLTQSLTQSSKNFRFRPYFPVLPTPIAIGGNHTYRE